MKLPYLLFDADNTLFNYPKASANAFSRMCSLNQIPNTPETWTRFETINDAFWDAYDRRELTKEELLTGRFVRFLQELSLERSPEACNADYLEALGNSVFPFPHAEEVCRELARRGHQLYILTNAVASVQHSRLQKCPFGEVFSGAFISEEAGAAKPDIAYYDYVFRQVPGLTHENCLVIGDSLSTDIAGANHAGLPCCWYNPSCSPADPALRIDYEIHDLRELLTLL